MAKRITLRAGAGKVYTDGETYGKIIHLEAGADKSAFKEIDEAEYKAILEAEAAENMPEEI